MGRMVLLMGPIGMASMMASDLMATAASILRFAPFLESFHAYMFRGTEIRDGTGSATGGALTGASSDTGIAIAGKAAEAANRQS